MSSDRRTKYVIRYEDRGGYLYAHVSGTRDTIATALAYWTEIGDQARKRGFERLLVVEAFNASASLMDVFHVASQLPAIVGDLRVAFVDERIQDLETNKFGEDVAVNRGGVGHVFPTEAAAIRWLESEA